jgi:rsbT antagonist protein RsbS
MPVPILKQGHYLIATVQSALSDREVVQLQDDLAGMVGKYRARGVILDVTALDIMDSFVSRSFTAMALIAKLKGANTVIVGIQPEVAFALVQLGLTLEGVNTALDLEEGLRFLRRLTRRMDTGVR